MIAAVVLWGSSAGFAKFLFQRDYTPMIITQTRPTFAFLALAAWFGWRRRGIFRIERRDVLTFVALGIVGVAATNYAYYFTVSEASVAAAILIQYTAPALVMLYMVLVRKEEKGSLLKVGALIVALLGCYLSVKGEGASLALPGWSIVSGPASAVFFSVMIIGSKRLLERYSQWTVLTYLFGVATIFWLFVRPPWVLAAEGYTWNDGVVFLLFSVVSVLVPYSLFAYSLRRLEATTVGIVGTLEPIVAIVAAWLMVGEMISATQLFGGLMILAAVLTLQLRGSGAEIPEEHA